MARSSHSLPGMSRGSPEIDLFNEFGHSADPVHLNPFLDLEEHPFDDFQAFHVDEAAPSPAVRAERSTSAPDEVVTALVPAGTKRAAARGLATVLEREMEEDEQAAGKRARGESKAIRPSERRARKNDRERQRREEVNACFDELASVLSVQRVNRSEKVSVLRSAISTVQSLRPLIEIALDNPSVRRSIGTLNDEELGNLRSTISHLHILSPATRVHMEEVALQSMAHPSHMQRADSPKSISSLLHHHDLRHQPVRHQPVSLPPPSLANPGRAPGMTWLDRPETTEDYKTAKLQND